jgi:hypothetical protein
MIAAQPLVEAGKFFQDVNHVFRARLLLRARPLLREGGVMGQGGAHADQKNERQQRKTTHGVLQVQEPQPGTLGADNE